MSDPQPEQLNGARRFGEVIEGLGLLVGGFLGSVVAYSLVAAVLVLMIGLLQRVIDGWPGLLIGLLVAFGALAGLKRFRSRGRESNEPSSELDQKPRV
jgi:hypothetical protein